MIRHVTKNFTHNSMSLGFECLSGCNAELRNRNCIQRN